MNDESLPPQVGNDDPEFQAYQRENEAATDNPLTNPCIKDASDDLGRQLDGASGTRSFQLADEAGEIDEALERLTEEGSDSPADPKDE